MNASTVRTVLYIQYGTPVTVKQIFVIIIITFIIWIRDLTIIIITSIILYELSFIVDADQKLIKVSSTQQQ